MSGKRIVTLVFTDIEGSTHLLGSLGDAFLPVLERQRAILGAAAAAHGGTGYATGGDGCVFLFGSPSSAVATAVEAQRALAVERWPDGVAVRVRMAIHAGEVADLGDELFGMALHHVSRILAVTHGGQVVVSDTAVALIERLPPDIALRDLGEHRLRDIVRPVRLHQAVADDIVTSFPPLKTATSSESHLPAATTSFIGREQELRELVDLLASRRLVTLTGVGGSGKTRLALEVARRVAERHRDGVRLVELAGLGTDALLPEAVLGALGMREPTAGKSASEVLCAALADRDLVLVLDNCEHVVGGVAALVSALLPACAQLHVLATGREQAGRRRFDPGRPLYLKPLRVRGFRVFWRGQSARPEAPPKRLCRQRRLWIHRPPAESVHRSQRVRGSWMRIAKRHLVGLMAHEPSDGAQVHPPHHESSCTGLPGGDVHPRATRCGRQRSVVPVLAVRIASVRENDQLVGDVVAVLLRPAPPTSSTR